MTRQAFYPWEEKGPLFFLFKQKGARRRGDGVPWGRLHALLEVPHDWFLTSNSGASASANCRFTIDDIVTGRQHKGFQNFAIPLPLENYAIKVCHPPVHVVNATISRGF